VTTNSSGKKGTSREGALAVLSSLLVLLFAGACAGPSGEGPAKVPFGVSNVPLGPEVDFVFDSLDERPVSAASTRGKPTVLVFVTTSSLAAQAEVDFLAAMAKHDAAEVNYAVVALEAGADRELVELYKKSLGISFPVAMSDASTRSAMGPFGDVSAVPVTVLLDRAGRIVWRVSGRVAKSAEIRAAMHGL
jgi:hypothetical protein